MSYKVILLDIDGTLANSEKKINEDTRKALIKAQEDGIRLVLASGRPAQGLKYFAETLEMDKHHGLGVCCNGAKVIDFESGEVLFNQAISLADIKALLEHLKKFEVVPLLEKDDYVYVNDVFNSTIDYKGEDFNVLKYETRSNNYMLCEKADLAAFVDFEPNKLLTYGQPEYLKEHWEEMAAPFKGRLNSMFTADFYYEYTALDIDKTKAIRTVLEPLGYAPEEMIAFGDAQNDRSMIEYVGTGVAMGNASDELKYCCDMITLTNDEDGIARALELLL